VGDWLCSEVECLARKRGVGGWGGDFRNNGDLLIVVCFVLGCFWGVGCGFMVLPPIV
jgi:hypothetical protein